MGRQRWVMSRSRPSSRWKWETSSGSQTISAVGRITIAMATSVRYFLLRRIKKKKMIHSDRSIEDDKIQTRPGGALTCGVLWSPGGGSR